MSLNHFIHYRFFFYFECVYMLCLCACVNSCVPLCMSGCQGSTSGVGPHILQGLRLGLSLSLIVHCCEWQDGWLGSIQKFSCVYFSSHCVHVNITNADITHSFVWALEI